MDDFNLSTLTESRNEYCALLLSKITPFIIQGVYSIFNEAYKLCHENDEEEKYLMTFQNFLGRVTKWNQEIINNETERIIKSSGCNYLEDLLTCVHVTQLKLLTSVRVGEKQKKIDIEIPKLNNFIHQVYILVARRVYKNVFLFDKYVAPLQQQKNLRELEIIVKECILNVIRDNMPLESILRSYLDETQEENVEEIVEEVKEEIRQVAESDETSNKQGGSLPETQTNTENINTKLDDSVNTDMKQVSQIPSSFPLTNTDMNGLSDISTSSNVTPSQSLSFNDNDRIVEYNTNDIPTNANKKFEQNVVVSKSVDNLEQISNQRWAERAMEDDDSDDDDDYQTPLKFIDEPKQDIKLDIEDIKPVERTMKLDSKPMINDDEIITLY